MSRSRRLALVRSPISLGAAIAIVALFARLAPMGLYVTPDEPIWVHRSIQFLQAVQSGDWSLVPQTGHPGITTMALGAVGIKITQWLRPIASTEHLEWLSRLAWLAPENAAAFQRLRLFLPAGRVLVALTTSLGLTVVYLRTRRHLGERSARWLGLLLALDPFFAGHAGLLHTDALQATFVLLAVVLALPDVRSAPQPKHGFVVSPKRKAARVDTGGRSVALREALRWAGIAFCLALAGLTKTLGLLAAPGLALALFLWGTGTWRKRVLRVGFIAALSLCLLLALYPTFFAAPREAVTTLLQAVTYHEGIGLRDVYFLGTTRSDPGPWFYPLVLLFRLTPPTFLGLLAVTLRRRHAPTLRWTVVGAAALPALGYALALTLATKKFDRYLLSAMPLLTLIAALPLANLRRAQRRLVLALLLLPWAAVMVVPLHYATPLLGGPRGATQIVPLGWGEGAGLAAGRLNRLLDDAASSLVLTHNVPGTASRFVGAVQPYEARLLGCADAVIGASAEKTPGYSVMHPVRVGGRELTYIYRSPYPVQEIPSLPLVLPARLPGLPSQVSDEAVAPATGTESLANWLNGRFVPGGTFLWVRADVCAPHAGAHLTEMLTQVEALGQIACRSSEPLWGFDTARCEVRSSLDLDASHIARFAGALDLLATAWDAVPERANPLALRLRFLPQVALGEIDTYLTLCTGEGGKEIIWAEGGQRLVNATTWPAPLWPVGEVADATIYLWIPQTLPPGSYQLVLMLSGQGGWLSLAHGEGGFGGIELPLGVVSVPSQTVSPASLDLVSVVDPGWSGLRVLGIESSGEGDVAEVDAGRALRFSLGLQRDEGTPPRNLEWSLICDAGAARKGELPWGPSDPAQWARGARYEVRYAAVFDAELPPGPCRFFVQPPDDAERALEVAKVTVVQRSRQFESTRDPQIPLAVQVGDFGRLIGADLSCAICTAGQSLEVTLTWQGVDQAPVDATAFVHLVGPEGRLWAQSDQRPALGAAPTDTWLPGEIIIDTHTLDVPHDAPHGIYALYAGLYSAKSGVRQPVVVSGVRSAEQRAPLGSIQISR